MSDLEGTFDLSLLKKTLEQLNIYLESKPPNSVKLSSKDKKSKKKKKEKNEITTTSTPAVTLSSKKQWLEILEHQMELIKIKLQNLTEEARGGKVRIFSTMELLKLIVKSNLPIIE
jgi:hypothetical protein